MIGELGFFHTGSEYSETDGTLALESDIPKSGFKFSPCHLLDIQSQSNCITYMRRKAYLGHADKG